MANCKHTVRITAGKVYYSASAGMFLSRNVQQISIKQLAECHYDNTRNLNLIQSYLSVACFGFSPIYLSVLCSMSYSLWLTLSSTFLDWLDINSTQHVLGR